jgi:hypothetical protein
VEVRRFVSKLRVYQISWQDTGAVWIWNEFPDLFLIQSADANRGIYAEGKPSLRGQAWVAENILQFGPLGAAYPKANIPGVKEGDTASFLHLLAPGLADPEQPGQGGWGGRFRQLDRSRRQWVAAEDDHPESVDPLRRKQWTVGRWNEAIALDFAARMRWCVHSFRDANHVPVAAIDGDATPRIIRRTILSGERVSLDASRSRDPDGDALRYSWSQYVEAGSFRDGVAITGAGTPNAELTAPSVRRPETIHIILSVSDGGTPMLTAYRRIIFTILPREDKSEATRTASTDVSLARRPHR